MAWTLDQQRAINKRGGKILVSAAAGSGKTAVLSQRVLNYVLNGNDVDKLLIVTFTDAASVEMRTRIKKNIEDEVRKNPTDHLKRQLILIDNTKITTMDAFYNELVKQNFEKLGIKKDYKIQGLIGDNGIYQSTDFMLDDIAGIDELDITPEEFRAISDKYFARISDMIQQNNLLKMQIKYESDNLSEDISIESLKENFFEFLNGNRELNLKNKVYVKEMMNLVRSYDKYSLLNASKQVEDELSSGLYEFVRYPNSYFSNEERTCLDKITSIWKSKDFRNFKNLKLLRKRYNDILSGNEGSRKDIKKCVQKIDKILSNGIPTMKNASKVKNEMATEMI